MANGLRIHLARVPPLMLLNIVSILNILETYNLHQPPNRIIIFLYIARVIHVFASCYNLKFVQVYILCTMYSQ